MFRLTDQPFFMLALHSHTPQLLKDIVKSSSMQQNTSWWILGDGGTSSNVSTESKSSGIAGGVGSAMLSPRVLSPGGGKLMEANGSGSNGGGGNNSSGGGAMRFENRAFSHGKPDDKVCDVCKRCVTHEFPGLLTCHHNQRALKRSDKWSLGHL